MKRPEKSPTAPKPRPRARPQSAGPTLDAGAARAKVSPARLAAFDILLLVAEGRGHSDELLHSQHTDALSEQDRNLATALVMGVLRWLIALDAEIARHLSRPDQTLAEPVAMALRLGAFQLLHMDRIPAHAALSESVELCRAAGQPFASGMTNAILRKIASSPRPGKRVFESTAALAERLAHPQWLVDRWVTRYGRTAAQAICEADQSEPAASGLFPPDPTLPNIDDGSRLVAEIAAAALPDVGGRAAKVWDCCAAPGGKTLVLAHRLPQASLLATDVSARRLRQMESRMQREGHVKNVRTLVSDASALPVDEGLFDLVLCDVPCSGTGTLARNPEIRLRLLPEDLARQSARQRELLHAGLNRVSDGGRLVYSTCSLEPEENEAVVADALRDGAWKKVAPGVVPSLSVPLQGMLDEGALRTIPGVHGCDGFYAVVLERT